MAGDWIKMRTDLYRDPKVCRMADMLMDHRGDLAEDIRHQCMGHDMTVTRNVMRNVTVGALVSVWGICRTRGKRIDNDLILENTSLSIIDDLADLPGFSKVMHSVGWAVDADGSLVFPRFFEDWNVDPKEETRRQNAERQRRYREKTRNESNVTSNVTRNAKSNTEKSREEKSREEDKDIKDISPAAKSVVKEKPPDDAERVPIPEALDTDRFRKAWQDWIDDRRDRKKKMTYRAATLQLSRLLELGHDRAIAAIEISIANGWQGIHEPGGNGRQPAKQVGRVDAPPGKYAHLTGRGDALAGCSTPERGAEESDIF